MALFGVQLAISMIMASLISKLGGRCSLARWLLCGTGLRRYLQPTDEELRELAGIRKDLGGKGKGKGRQQDTKNTFLVPKHLGIQLDSVKVTQVEVMHLKFYPEYHWAVDYTLYSTIIYFLTEIYYGVVKPTNEMNLSVFWCILSLLMCLNVLGKLTAIYFRGDETMGERSMCLVMALVYLLIAMIVLIVNEDILEVGVDSAYRSFQENASAFLKTQGLVSSGPASKLIVKFTIAVLCAFLGTFFTFPGIRMSKMFWDSLKYCEGRVGLKILINLTYILPLVLSVLWIKPIGREMLTQTLIGGEPLMSAATFDSLRLHLIVLFVVLRIVMMPWFLQAFLNLAQVKLNEQIKEAGRILNTDIQKKVAGIYYYLCIVALQYIAPVLVILHCCFMYKTLGGGAWLGSLSAEGEDISAAANVTEDASGTTSANFLPESDDMKPATEHFAIALASLKQVFNATVFNGVFGFATWWSVFTLFLSSAVGSAYLTYFSGA